MDSMGFRMRRSLKIAPGVRLNVSARGVGISAGVRGARYSVHSSGRRTTSLSIPGSGIGWTSSTGGTRRSARNRVAPAPRSVQRTAPPEPAPLPTPGRLDPKGHRALFEAVQRGLGDPQPFEEVAQRHADVATPASLIGALASLAAGDREGAVRLLERVVSDASDVADHPFVTRYLVPRGVAVETSVAAGVTAALPLGREAATLTLAELRQAAGDPRAAISLVEDLPPSTIAAVSLTELYLQTERYDEVLDLTNGLSNEDEASALLLVFRGAALHALGHHDAAVEALKEALRARSRPAAIRHLALVQRADAYLTLGRRAAARKDLERVLAEDASVPGVVERLDAIRSGELSERPAVAPVRSTPPTQRDVTLTQRDWRRDVDVALAALGAHMKAATDAQKAALREALRPGQIPGAIAFGSAKVDGKSVGFMPVPVCLTDDEIIVVAKDDVHRRAVADLVRSDHGGSKFSGGSLKLETNGTIEVTGVRPHEATELFASKLPTVRAPAAAPSGDDADEPKPAAPPDWYPDPTQRHHYRYWDGSTWTDDVATNGVLDADPLRDG